MPHSASERPAFDRLAPEIQRWIREQGWEELRGIQSRAIHAILDDPGDVLVAADTAAGKTEAAFLPILTEVCRRTRPGAAILYISPLKALINDQFRRLDQLCDWLEVDVVRWHGDAPQAAKQRALRNPRGIVLITPESIEALLVRRPGDAKGLLGDLDAIIIDEIHAFLQGPRACSLPRCSPASTRWERPARDGSACQPPSVIPKGPKRGSIRTSRRASPCFARRPKVRN